MADSEGLMGTLHKAANHSVSQGAINLYAASVGFTAATASALSVPVLGTEIAGTAALVAGGSLAVLGGYNALVHGATLVGAMGEE